MTKYLPAKDILEKNLGCKIYIKPAYKYIFVYIYLKCMSKLFNGVTRYDRYDRLPVNSSACFIKWKKGSRGNSVT